MFKVFTRIFSDFFNTRGTTLCLKSCKPMEALYFYILFRRNRFS